MIDERVIVKSINYAIWKCGQKLLLNHKVKESFNKFHDTYCNTDTTIEHAIITDSDGNVVWEGEGDEDSVSIPSNDELKEMYKEYGTLL